MRLLWFFVWRMTLWGMCLCATAMVVMVTFWTIFTLLRTGGYFRVALTLFGGIVFGAKGAFVGLFLGIICGMALFAIARVHYRRRCAEHEGCRRAAGRASALVSTLALLAEWQLHGLLDRYSGFLEPFDFVVWRILGGHDVHGTVAFDLTTVVNITTMVVIPTLLFSLVMRWAGRNVAGQYANKQGGPTV